MAQAIARYAVLTPFDKVDALVGVCALKKFDVFVLATQQGAVVLREVKVPKYDEWDIRNITGPSQEDLARIEHGTGADSGVAVAAYLSRLSKYGVVLFDSVLSDNSGFDEGVSGEVTAQRFLDGKQGENLSASILLYSLDERLEAFLLGNVSAEELGAVSVNGVSPRDGEKTIQTHSGDEDTFSDFGHNDVDFDEGSEYL